MKKILALVAVAALVAFAAPAFAANPFMDVPMNSWAYDAVSQLASQGVISGYPDGTFKGNQPMTRYEMASIVARALAVVDMDKASKQDVEMLKRLVVEFKDELDALGVVVDELDSRVAVLEENIGGWKLNGEFELRFRNLDNAANENRLYFDDARITMQKKIDDKVTWVGRFENQGSDLVDDGAGDGFRWEKFYLDVQLPWDMTMRAGRQVFMPTSYTLDNDSIFWDSYSDGFLFTKPFGMGEFVAYIGHEEVGDTMDNWTIAGCDYFEYYLGMQFDFNEKFNSKLWGYMVSPEDTTGAAAPADGGLAVYGGSLEFGFTEGVNFVAEYMMEDIDNNSIWFAPGEDDSPGALHAIVTVDQDVFGFTSFGAEYYDFDRDFVMALDPFANYAFDIVMNAGYYANGLNDDTSALGLFLTQQWNPTWKTFQRYVTADQTGAQDVTNWSFGIGYNYTSNLYFELVYDDVDYDGSAFENDDSLIQFKTYVKF